MTRKDYVAIAEVIKSSLDTMKEGLGVMAYDYDSFSFTAGHDSALEAISQGLIKVFEEDNPRFDSERFLRACGL